MNPLEKPLNQMAAAIDAARPELVQRMGNVALVFIDDNFRKQGFQGAAFEPWAPRKKDKDPGRKILIGKGTGNLRRSPFISYSDAEKAIITSSLPYSKIHNEGYTGTVRIVGHIRMQTTKDGSKQKQVVPKHTKYMRMPKRQFMGPSPVLNAEIIKMLKSEVPLIFKLIL